MKRKRFSKYLKLLMFWRWLRRLRCHHGLKACQYVDAPNDNGGEWGRSGGWRLTVSNEPQVKKDDRIAWRGRRGVVKDIDTTAQKTERGRMFGWPYAAWVLFDDAKSQDDWSCVNAFDCKAVPNAS